MKLELPDSIEKPVDEVITPVATGIGKTLSDLWFLAMGGISQCAEKKRIKYSADLDKLKKSLEEKIKSIPEERKIEPDTQIAAQALEDAKYCAENKEVREMFANLIASTMDSQIYKGVHPSYSSILKQMTPDDAKFLKRFCMREQLPLCNFTIKYKKGSHSPLLQYVFFDEAEADVNEIQSNAFILSALERLGLIHINFDTWLSDSSCYKFYEDSKLFQRFKEIHNNDNQNLVLEKGYADITVLGDSLLKICCPLQTVNTTLTYLGH